MTANFAINTYTLTYTAGANGTITRHQPADGRTTAPAAPRSRRCRTPATTSSAGATASLTAARTDTNVTADLTVTATFAINTYTLTYTAGANGTITRHQPADGDHGASGTAVTAVPDTGYHFVSWSDGSTAARPAHGLAVVGRYAYIADGADGLRIVDVSDPQAPTAVGRCDTPGSASDVSVCWSYAYVADGDAGLQVVDVTDPAHPAIVTAAAAALRRTPPELLVRGSWRTSRARPASS